jgi:rubredoxin
MLDVCRVFVNAHGGILPIGDLRKIIMTSNHFSLDGLSIGNYQNLYFDVLKENINSVKDRLGHLSIHYDISAVSDFLPIVHSGYLKDLVETTAWLTETYYVDIVNTFDHVPKISIRVIDPIQSTIAHTSSQLNFIASNEEDYWYVFLNLTESNCMQYIPMLIHTNDIARFSLFFEKYYFYIEPKGFHLELFINELYLIDDWNFKNYSKLPNEVNYTFFQYEGIYKYDIKKYYLGIFNPTFKYKIEDLEKICILCIDQNIGFVYLTPNRSLLIKNINQNKLNLWTDFLSVSNINTHHSITDLCWNIHGNEVSIVKIKKQIGSILLKLDTRCEDIIIGINNPSVDRFYSIQIVEKYLFKLFGYKCFVSYFIYYKKDLNPYNNEIISFADNVLKGQLFNFLSFLLTKKETKNKLNELELEPKNKSNLKSLLPIYECNVCKSRFDSNFGDSLNNVEAGVLFEDLQENYSCGVCGSEKKYFVILKEYR